MYDEETGLDWINGLATQVMPCVDLPLLHRMYQAWQNDDIGAALAWNRYLLASRESAELLQEDQAMGLALRRLAQSFEFSLPAGLCAAAAVSYAAVFSWLGVHWDIAPKQAMAGYRYGWVPVVLV